MISRPLIAAAAGVLSLALAAEAGAAPCRDATGKFVTCPAPAPAKAVGSARCRDTKGKYIACVATGRAPNGAVASTATVTPRASVARSTRVSPAPTGAAVNAAAVGQGTPTARCRDGALSYSQHRSGTCAGHGGVAQWMGG